LPRLETEMPRGWLGPYALGSRRQWIVEGASPRIVPDRFDVHYGWEKSTMMVPTEPASHTRRTVRTVLARHCRFSVRAALSRGPVLLAPDDASIERAVAQAGYVDLVCSKVPLLS